MLLVFFLIKGDLTISQINSAFSSIRNNEAVHVGCANDERDYCSCTCIHFLVTSLLNDLWVPLNS